MIYITRKEHFNAAHKLFRAEWSNEKNEKVFGKCSNPNWHGHNYDLFVTVKGEINPETGFLVDLKLLSKIIKEKGSSTTGRRIRRNGYGRTFRLISVDYLNLFNLCCI